MRVRRANRECGVASFFPTTTGHHTLAMIPRQAGSVPSPFAECQRHFRVGACAARRVRSVTCTLERHDVHEKRARARAA
jgi:hypothetical protein